MRIKLVLFFCFISITAFAQNGITFEVEELSKPEIWLSTRSCDDIYKELINWRCSMEHIMKLYESSFEDVKSGKKKREYRLSI